MAEAKLNKPLPAITTEAKRFWDAAAQNKLVMQRCQDCRAWVWTPRPSCFECGSERLDWTQMSGRGEIYSFTVIRQVVGRAASKAFEPDIPYVIAWIDLEEGPRMLSSLVNVEPDPKVVKCDMPVEIVFSKLTDDITIPLFQPAK